MQAFFTGLGVLVSFGAALLALWNYRTTIRATRQSLRAYVYMKAFSEPDLAGIPILVDFTFKNGGKTPANDVRVHVAASIGDEVHEKRDGTVKYQSIGLTGPDQEFTIRASTGASSNSAFTSLRNGQLPFVAKGHILYKDAFGIDRRTDFKIASARTVKDSATVYDLKVARTPEYNTGT